MSRIFLQSCLKLKTWDLTIFSPQLIRWCSLGNCNKTFVVAVHLLIVSASLATPWTVARQAPPPMGSSRQEHWIELTFPSPGDLPDPGIEPASLVSPALVDGCFYHWVLPKVYPNMTSFTWITELPNDDMGVNFIVPYLCVCVSHSVVSDSLWPHGLLSGSSVHEILIVF